MSVIEDTRKLLQDFLAPELRELSARVGALEERMEARFNAVDKRIDRLEQRVEDRLVDAERLASERHGQVLQAIARLADIYDLRERITRIEAREKTN